MAKKRKSRNVSHRDELRASLASGKKRLVYRSVHLLKTERSYGQAKQMIDALLNPISQSLLFENLFSPDWNGLHRFPSLPPSRDWVQELGWMAHVFRRTPIQLQKFIVRRHEFGVAFVTGCYEKASAILAEIEREFGYSFWLLERRLMLAQQSEGFEGNKKELKSIQDSCLNPYVAYCASYISNRVEPHISWEAYRKQVEEALSELKELGRNQIGLEVEVQISPSTSEWAEFPEHILHRGSGRPLIDRYNLAIKVTSAQFFNKNREVNIDYL